jgi:hypothetical protein
MKYPVHITEHKKGLKLENFLSLNVMPGEFCEENKTDCTKICSRCYGYYMITRYPRLKKCLIENSRILSGRSLSSGEIDLISSLINAQNKIALRLNSIGELINPVHIRNYNEIAGRVKIPVTLWTKRSDLLFDEFNRPAYNETDNKPAFKVIRSCHSINRYILPGGCDPRIQHTFNVYDNPELMIRDMNYEKENGMPVMECRGSCHECMICYNPRIRRRYTIFELTKKAQREERKKGSA